MTVAQKRIHIGSRLHTRIERLDEAEMDAKVGISHLARAGIARMKIRSDESPGTAYMRAGLRSMHLPNCSQIALT